MSAPEPSAKPLPHNLDPEGGGSEIALSKKRETGKVSVAKFYRITSDYLLPYMRLKVQTFPIKRRSFNFAPGLCDIP
jgi:hypothetical protein